MNSLDIRFAFGPAPTRVEAGQPLRCEFTLLGDRVTLADLQAIETSVMWATNGKGTEDIGVHYFQRIGRRRLQELPPDHVHEFTVQLPKTPLTYHGQIIQIDWRVRVKLFLPERKQIAFDHPLILGHCLQPNELDPNQFIARVFEAAGQDTPAGDPPNGNNERGPNRDTPADSQRTIDRPDDE